MKCLLLWFLVVVTQGKTINDLVVDLEKEKKMKEIFNFTNTDVEVFGQPDVEYRCVPLALCKNGTTDGNGKKKRIIDVRFRDDHCPSYTEIWCKKSDILNEALKLKPEENKRKGCGYRNEDGVDFRIMGNDDNEAQFGEFPWMVAVLDQKMEAYQCGGSLVHPQVVLTVAHCVYGLQKRLKVRAGEWDTQSTNELSPHQDRNVISIEIHESYSDDLLFNDIALLFLDSPITEAANVGSVCLPPKTTNSDNLDCFAAGWGKNLFGRKGDYQVILKKIELPVVNRETCQKQLKNTRLGESFKLHKSFICAGGKRGVDTCEGDGGSPLVCPIAGSENRYYAAGIVAWGIGCGEINVPGVYVHVASFRDWIDQKMQRHNFSIDSYQYK